MSQFEFSGRFKTGDAEAMSRLLQDALKIEKPRTKEGRTGVEMMFEREGLSFYCQEVPDPKVPTKYLIEGNMDGSLETVRARFQQLFKLAGERGIVCRLDYSEVDEDGEEIGEPHSFG